MIELTEFEEEMLETIKKQKKRSEKEIEEFCELLISIREKPEENPQLNKKR